MSMPSPPAAAAMAAAEAKANAFRLRLALQALLVHFKSNGYMRDKTMDLLDFRVVSQVLGATARKAEVRETIGRDRQIWNDLQETFEAAVPSFERRSIPGPDPAQPEFDQPSGPLIAANYPTLVQDIERMNNLIGICKNVLASGDVAQDNAAKSRFDQAVFKIINVCVKVTARGYDGDAGPDEERWQTVVNDYKKLLINCLLFLNNLVTQNERRKLMLWVQLFDSTADGLLAPIADNGHVSADLTGLQEASEHLDPSANPASSAAVANDNPAVAGLKRLEDLEKKLLAATFDLHDQSPSPSPSPHPRNYPHPYRGPTHKIVEDAMREGKNMAETDTGSAIFTGAFLCFIGRNALSVRQGLSERAGTQVEAADIARECQRQWHALTDADKIKWCGVYGGITGRAVGLASQPKGDTSVTSLAHRLQRLRTEFENCSDSYAQITQAASAAPVRGSLETVRDLASQLSLDSTMPLEVSNYLANGNADAFASHDATDTDYLMVYSAEYGADILQRGKDDLMKRLEPFAEGREQNAPAGTGQAPHEPRDTAQLPPARNGHLILPRTADYFSEAESEEEDCGIPGDDGRGLLTDVPLILGPNEIEVLPMIILSGIVPPPSVSTPGYGSTPEETLAVRNMHTVRCHFFLAQDNGRNLLRELLIFVAAWDLREDELYFKFMVKIMESILNNDLMPFSYHAFRESKDIISPAQAVIMKLLTNIFRLRQARYQQETARAPQENDAPAQYPTRVDVHMVNFLLTEFRRHIIPQTCALIFLQGQIRAGHASPEDFPLNLWDMERMYEGIYQYLEFFAILTECDAWKQMMAEWDVTSELVTLLKELDAAIPRSTLAREMSKIPSALKQPPPVLPAMPQPPPQPEPINAQAPVSVERPYDVTSPVGPGMPESTLSFHQPTAAPVSGAAGPPHDDEPSDFPWKNLKKLTVLVLSSLTWKSQRVQDQVREHDGIKVVLNCIKHDDFNPYIREHAIMALRFLVEGNDANREVVRALEARAAETARAKGVAAAAGASASAGRRRGANPKAVVPPGGSDATNGAEAKGAPLPTGGLFDLMKEVMREMPARVRGQALDKHKTDLLRQLDREFD